MSQQEAENRRLVEALLFAATEPVGERSLAKHLPEGTDLKQILASLEAEYAERGVNLVRSGSSWAFRTAPDLAARLNREIEVGRKLSRAAVEVLAVVAYHQPVTRAEIEEVRGVSISKGTMDVLLENGWIKPAARRRTPGRPLTWRTTDGFLDHFGITALSDLPGVEEMKAAGLLDVSPSINAYRTSGEFGAALGQDDPLPDMIGDGDGDENIEPLDPDDAAAPDGGA
jgi:segregation and condensation protein B